MINNNKNTEVKLLFRISSISAFVFFIGYILTILIYTQMGVPPKETGAWLSFVGNNINSWWLILIIMVITDIILLPIMLSLYQELKDYNKYPVAFGTLLIFIFVILDLTITWPNYAFLIDLSNDFNANETIKENLINLTRFSVFTVNSTLLSFYIIVLPAIGIILISISMNKGGFSNTSVIIGLLSGLMSGSSIFRIFGIPFFEYLIIPGSMFMGIWIFLIGLRLNKLSKN
jgi:hypothetical protein